VALATMIAKSKSDRDYVLARSHPRNPKGQPVRSEVSAGAACLASAVVSFMLRGVPSCGDYFRRSTSFNPEAVKIMPKVVTNVAVVWFIVACLGPYHNSAVKK